MIREVRCLDDPRAVCLAAADEFQQAHRDAVTARGRFRVALSGGSTPHRLHGLLRMSPYAEKIGWQEIDFFFGDERCVAPTHPDSNFRMAQETLFAEQQIDECQIHRMPAEQQDLDAAARAYEAELSEVFGLPERERSPTPPRFDLILLGMGPDGHTASLFPETEALGETQRWVVGNLVPQLDCSRMTFTYPLINAAATVIFLITGAGKAEPLREVLEGNQLTPVSSYPARGVAPRDGKLLFLIDREAARDLAPETLSPKNAGEP